MKFKKVKGEEGLKRITITDTDGDVLVAETSRWRKDGIYIRNARCHLSRSKALKLAWAIIGELDPSMLA
jgi:hypothetical protein